MDNLLLYVLDGYNTCRGDALDVVASQHLITAHDVVLTLFPSEFGHPLYWVLKLVEALRLWKHKSAQVGGTTFVGAQNVARIGDYHIARLG